MVGTDIVVDVVNLLAELDVSELNSKVDVVVGTDILVDVVDTLAELDNVIGTVPEACPVVEEDEIIGSVTVKCESIVGASTLTDAGTGLFRRSELY